MTLGIIFIALVAAVSLTPVFVQAAFASDGVCSTPMCAIAQHEYCDASKGTAQFNNCLTRNGSEDNRFHQCFQHRLRDCEREQQAQRTQSAKPKTTANVCSMPMCQVVQYEQCDPKTADSQDCLARNRQEEARWKQCMDQRRQ